MGVSHQGKLIQAIRKELPKYKEDALALVVEATGGRDESDIGINDRYWAIKTAVAHALPELLSKPKEVVEKVEEVTIEETKKVETETKSLLARLFKL